MLFYLLTGNWRALLLSLMLYWDAPSSDLGFEAPASAEPAAPAADAAADGKADDSAGDQAAAHADGDGASDADADADADGETDPLDLLAERDETADQRPIEERYKGLSKRARKLERELKKALPDRQALKAAGLDVRTLLSSHSQLAALHQAANANPKLRAILFGEADDAGEQGERHAATRDEPVKYPFDTDDPVGGFMKGFHESTQRQAREVISRLDALEKTLGGRVERIERGTTQAQVSSIRHEWKSAADAAAKELDPAVRVMFLDNMVGAAENLIAGRHNRTPQQVIDHYLKGIRASTKQKNRASEAAKQLTAERNDTLPRRPGAGAGTPASARSKAVPRLEDFNRNLQRSYGRAG